MTFIHHGEILLATKENDEAYQTIGCQVRMSQVRLQVDAEGGYASETVRQVFKSELGEQGEGGKGER